MSNCTSITPSSATPIRDEIGEQPVPAANNGRPPNQPAADDDNALRVFPVHLAELRASGLSDETIRAASIYSEHDRRKLATLTNRKSWSAKLGSGLVFPYCDETGTVVLNRVKPERPQTINGKSAKYLSPSGSGVRAYIPPCTHNRIAAGATEIIVTEGEKKTLAAYQAGFTCIGLSGVDCWQKKRSTALLADLERIEWIGRTAFIIFDSDAADNSRVRENVLLLAAALQQRGALVKVVWLPSGPEGAKAGLDDFLLAQGPVELRKLMDRAEPPESPEPESFKQPANLADPADVAAKILAACKRDGLPRLRFWRGSWWLWQDGHYTEQDDAEVRAEVVNHFTRDWFSVKSPHVSNVLEHLRAQSLLRSTLDPPTWLNSVPHGFNADECVATKNGIVHLPSLVSQQKPSVVPATPTYFTTNALDFDLDPNAPRPATWLWFLDALWGKDEQSIGALQEIFGYLLTSDTRQQKIFLLVGPKRGGKGTIARVLTGVVGADNVVAPTLSSLTERFGLAPLIGKSVGVISDARLSNRADQAVVVERLLSISGEDAQTVDRKNRSAMTCKLPTRFLILTNELPRFSDASGAIVSRMVLLKLTKSFYGIEDEELTAKLLAERQGILLWAIEGWRRLRKRRRFTQPESGLESIAELDELASPIKAFVKDCCQVGPTEVVKIDDLYQAWKKWCETQGREKFTGTKQTFGRDLKAAFSHIRNEQPRDDDNSRFRVYRGISLKGSP